ncbi:MAG: hypothetical protein BGP06_17280 [Rhizobiales bacterium 65-9]|mgnify:CR=1 FL=1|nr:cytochrome c family protein [Hyphomicrobiales bacterium]OJY38172.1 MAG: hypothetical protein BGP06_17280 [Rhizobiales bacterium 65-9]
MASTTPGKDPLLFNKVSGAILGTCLFVMSLNLGAEAIFHVSKPAIPGYDLPSAPEEGAAGAEPAAVVVAPIAERLAKADKARGETVAKQCLTCHSLKADGSGAQVGPHLFGVFDRQKASTNFSGYSAAMKAKSGEKWDAEHLDAFITNPRAALPGTTMTFAGLNNPDRRADLIAYLETVK